MYKSRMVTMFACMLAVLSLGSACERTVTTVNEVYTPSACFDCHSDQNTVLKSAEGQWNYSQHASGENIDRNASSYGQYCQVCHTSQGFVAQETGATIPDPVENPTAIHCFTCHAPHTNGNLQLRVTAAQTLEDGTSYDMSAANICAACHHARQNVNTYVAEPTELSEHWGPHHSPQSDLLWGSNGYEYPGYGGYGQTNHRSGAVQDGCLDCHFKAANKYVVSGHSFNMTFIAHEDTVRNVRACATCHADMSGADDFDRLSVQDSVHTLMEDLKTRLIAAGLIDDTGHPLDGVSTSQDSAGAVWNFLLLEEDRSLGIHNPAYAIDLLKSAIEFIQNGPGGTPEGTVAGKIEDDVISRK